jgi:decaprenyl-phosphate phosphoribosyltransferase
MAEQFEAREVQPGLPGDTRPLAPAPAPDLGGPPEPPIPPTWRALVRTARPKQWIKNVLVFAAPAAAGVLDEPKHLAQTFVAFVAFCLAASGTYFFNDALDAHADRLHPTKQFRPVAAGHISERLAKVIAVILVVLGIVVAVPVQNGKLAAVVAAYVVLTLTRRVAEAQPSSTSARRRRIRDPRLPAVLPLASRIRLVSHHHAGASLFMVTGKRPEQIKLGGATLAPGHAHRVFARVHSYVRAVASSVTIMAYCLWAFESAAKTGTQAWFEISIVPFVLAILRYAHVIEQGRGGAPEDIILSDHVIQVLGLLWAVTFAIGVYV